MFLPTSPSPPRATILQVPSIQPQSKAPTWRRRVRARAAWPLGRLHHSLGSRRTDPPGRARLSVAPVTADKPWVGHTTLALFLAAAILVALFEDSDRERSRGPIQPDRFRLASAVQIAALVVVGPWAGALVAAVGTAAGGLFHGTHLRRPAC